MGEAGFLKRVQLMGFDYESSSIQGPTRVQNTKRQGTEGFHTRNCNYGLGFIHHLWLLGLLGRVLAPSLASYYQLVLRSGLWAPSLGTNSLVPFVGDMVCIGYVSTRELR